MDTILEQNLQSQIRIEQLRQEGMTWREIAKLPEFDGIPAGSLCSFAKGDWEPKDNEIRKKLGYREIIEVKVFRNKEGKFSKGQNNDDTKTA